MKPLFLLGILFSISTCATAQVEKSQSRIRIYDGASPLFPKGWLKSKVKALADAPEQVKIAADTLAIARAIDKYPAYLIKKEIRHIYLVGKLRFAGAYFTGTIAGNVLFIASRDNPDIQKTFHHEFSSILLRKHASFSFESKWKSLSPDLLNCSSSAAIKDGYFSMEQNAHLLNKGYLSSYSLSNWENDFNMYAENIFSGDPLFWTLVENYPLIKRKTKLVIDFYQKVHPVFTESFFRLLQYENGIWRTAANERN